MIDSPLFLAKVPKGPILTQVKNLVTMSINVDSQ